MTQQHLNQLRQSLVFAALWPLIIARNLPEHWEYVLRDITSVAIVRLIVETRLSYLQANNDSAERRALAVDFAREVVQPDYHEGITKLLDDLCDPHRGGAVLVAFVVLRDAEPTKSHNLPSLLRLLIAGGAGAAIQGIIGNRADALIVDAWESLKRVFEPPIRSSKSGFGSLFVALLINEGNSYAHQQEYDQAIDSYTEAIRLDPDNATAYRNRGAAYGYKDDFDQAIVDLTNAIRLNPDDAIAYFNRGLIYTYRGNSDRAIVDFTQAIVDFTQAIQLNPDDAQAYGSRGAVYRILKEYDYAIADLTRALEMNPENINGYYNRAHAYEGKGEPTRAIADYNRILLLSNDPALRKAVMSDLASLEASESK